MLHSHKPEWMRDFYEKHGIWPIAGGSGEENPPNTQQQENQEGQEGGQGNEGLRVDLSEGGSVTEPTTSQKVQQGQSNNGDQTFTPDDIARARKEEKDKLYPRLNQLEEELKQYRQEREQKQKEQEEEERRKAEEEEEKFKEDADAKSLVEKLDQDWQKKFEEIEKEREQERALLEKERRYSQLNEYRQQRLSDPEVENSIMPELRDLVQGESEEEIDSAIANMQERTERILDQARSFAQTQRQQMPGVRATDPSSIGPVEENESAQQTVTSEQIKSMSMQDYAKHRDALLQAAKSKANQQGLYS